VTRTTTTTTHDHERDHASPALASLLRNEELGAYDQDRERERV